MTRYRSRFPFYPDDSDYKTNAPSYYDDLARKQKLIKLLAEKIWEYDKTLGESLEDIQEILEQVIFKIGEGFNKEINDLLIKWVEDGTLNHIINEELMNEKANKSDLQTLETEVKTKFSRKTINIIDEGGIPDANYRDNLTNKWYVDSEHTIKATDNYQIIQKSLEKAERTGYGLYIPAGNYFVSNTIRTQFHNGYHTQKGIEIFGDGKSSKLVGVGQRRADYSSPQFHSRNFLLAVHGSNNYIHDLSFEHGAGGLFIGHGFEEDKQDTHTSFNTVERIYIYHIGTGLLMTDYRGVYYNKLRDFHIAHAQIGVHLAKGVNKLFNVNRNYFEGFRVNRAMIGYFVENSSGSTFNSCFSESLKERYMYDNNMRGISDLLPEEHPVKPTAILNVSSGNKFMAFTNEDVEISIYSEGHNAFYTEGHGGGSSNKIIIPEGKPHPKILMTESVISIGGLIFQINPNLIADIPAGLSLPRIFDQNGFIFSKRGSSVRNKIEGLNIPSSSFINYTGKKSSGFIHILFNFRATLLNSNVKIPLDRVSTDLDLTPYTDDLSGVSPFPFTVHISDRNGYNSNQYQQVRGFIIKENNEFKFSFTVPEDFKLDTVVLVSSNINIAVD